MGYQSLPTLRMASRSAATPPSLMSWPVIASPCLATGTSPSGPRPRTAPVGRRAAVAQTIISEPETGPWTLCSGSVSGRLNDPLRDMARYGRPDSGRSSGAVQISTVAVETWLSRSHTRTARSRALPLSFPQMTRLMSRSTDHGTLRGTS
ncbi:hypothetical protein FA13DRAFT_199962 [Coprinellus micaceus]|uniref:Uncharacterized protein n=1 Tax=Coprinellus micaceus TaxID=71717 RepID=A0A4Y7SGH0_COPMI|nr:hypothetical protein FA13DRAFT_199962 [Coprinellus micaceus]